MNEKTVWKPMSSAPRDGLIVLKCYVEGGHWPVIGRYNHVHGGFVAGGVMGQPEHLIMAAEAWTEIPRYDTGIHAAREVAA